MFALNKKMKAGALATALAVTLSMGAGVAAASPTAATTTAASASSAQEHHAGGAMNILASITGMSVQDLTAKYPQKTAWQIAQSLGKLDELKTKFLSTQKTFIDKLVSEGKLTAADGGKVYADLQKRVANIDGKNTVILGRPGYRPEFKKDGQ